MAEEKRGPRSYKCKESVYKKAMKRAKKNKTTLAELIESWVTAYGEDRAMLKLDAATFATPANFPNTPVIVK